MIVSFGLALVLSGGLSAPPPPPGPPPPSASPAADDSATRATSERTQKALTLLRSGRPVEAEAAFRAALAAVPEDGWARLGLGLALAAQERLEQALPELADRRASSARLGGRAPQPRRRPRQVAAGRGGGT